MKNTLKSFIYASFVLLSTLVCACGQSGSSTFKAVININSINDHPWPDYNCFTIEAPANWANYAAGAGGDGVVGLDWGAISIPELFRDAVNNGFNLVYVYDTGQDDFDYVDYAANAGCAVITKYNGNNGTLFDYRNYGSPPFVKAMGPVPAMTVSARDPYVDYPPQTDYGPQLEFLDDGAPVQSYIFGFTAAKYATLKSQNPTWNVFDVRQGLRQTCTGYASGWNQTNGYGLPQVNTRSTVNVYNQPALPTSAFDLDAGPPIQPYAQILPGGQIYFSWYNFHQTAFQSTVIQANGVTIYDGDGTSFVWTPNISGNIVINYYTKLVDGRMSRSEIYTTIPVSEVAVPIQVTTTRNTPVDLNVFQNGSGGGANKIVTYSPLPPTTGTISINNNQTIHFAPSETFIGTATFTYETSVGGYTTQSSVTVNVVTKPDDQAPVITFSGSTSQTLTERTTISLPFTVTDTYTPVANLTNSVVSSSPAVYAQVVNTGSGLALQITGDMPVNGATVTLTYADWDHKSSSVTFQVNVVPDPTLPHISEGSMSSASVFSFNMSGPANSQWNLYESSDLKNWTLLGPVTFDSTGAASFADDNTANISYRFYKLSNGTSCSQAFGFERETAQSGYTLIANQLNGPSYTLEGLFNPMPDGTTLPSGTVIDIWNGTTFVIYTWNGSHWHDGSGNLADNLTLTPGQSAYIQNNSGSPFTVTFAGLVQNGPSSVTLVPGYNYVSSTVPISGGITTVLGYIPQDEDIVENDLGIWTYFDASEGLGPTGWYDGGLNPVSEPVINVGEGFYIDNAQASPETWTQTYDDCSGAQTCDVPNLSNGQISSGTFSFNIANGEPYTYWGVYESTDLKNWTLVAGVTLDGNGNGSYQDGSVGNASYRFYKLSNGNCCSQAIGFERETAAASGYTLIANQLNGPSDTLEGLFNPMPDGTTLPSGTVIDIWNGTTFVIYTWNGSHWHDHSGNLADNVTVTPGEGVYIQNNSGSSFTVTFAGLVQNGQSSITLAPGYNYVSSTVPISGGITSVLGYTPQDWDMLGNDAGIWTYIDASEGLGPTGWYDGGLNPVSEPVINVGEGFYIDNAQASPETWTQTYDDCQ